MFSDYRKGETIDGCIKRRMIDGCMDDRWVYKKEYDGRGM